MHIYYKMMIYYLFIEPMMPLHCILNHEKAISAESASTTWACSFELSLHWVRFEPSIKLQNCEDDSRSKSHKSHHQLILQMGQQSLMLRGLSSPTVFYVISFPNSKLSILESNLHTASDPGQLAHLLNHVFHSLLTKTFFKIVFCIEIACKMCFLHHECYVLRNHGHTSCGSCLHIHGCSSAVFS